MGSYSSINAGSGDDSIENSIAESVTINAGAGNDTVDNYSDFVTISGDAGNDVIYNSGDSVSINGGTGNDTIFAGSGAEVFQYAAGDGNDLIRNFSGEDVIQITEGSISSYSISSGDLIFNVGSESITLKNMANHYITVIDAEGNSTNQLYTNGTTQRDVIQSILGAAANSTLTTAEAILDEALKATNTTVFSGIQDAVDKFLADQAAAGDADTFLRDYIGIDLNNKDTGAITGWDAGGSAIKNAEDIVPESGSISTPTGSSFTINGLTITYNSEDLSTNEQMIVNGLYSWWMKSSLDLIYESYGLDFDNGSPAYDSMPLLFYSANDGTLAYVQTTYDDDSRYASSADLVINTFYYPSLSADNFDGQSDETFLYLDRTLAHELTHAVQMAAVGRFSRVLTEGLADLTQGVDDEQYDEVLGLAENSSLLSGVMADALNDDIVDSELNKKLNESTNYVYAAGYMFWRYLGKQIADNYSAGSDTGSSTGSDSGSSTGSDSGSSTGSDTGSDNGSDTGSNTGSDTGSIEDTGSTLVDDSLVAAESISASVFSADSSLLGLAIDSNSISGSLFTGSRNYVAIDNSGNLFIVDSSRADAVISVDAANYSASISVTSGDDYEFEFMGGTAISQWNASLGSGNDTIRISNVTSGKFNGRDGNDIFSISSDLNGNVTLSGDANDTEYSDIFYAQSKAVSNAGAQNVITVTDADFNNGDVLIIDAGVENLTKDFFGDAQFKNFATAEQASTAGTYAKNVFDASKLVKNLNMNFSMVKMSDSSVAIDSNNMIDDDNITNVVWTNSNATTIDFSNQDNNALIFTNTNNRADVVSLSADYDDTIHAGTNDSIFSGDGNDFINADGRSVVIDGGDGDDTIIAAGSTHIIYDNNSVGDDLVQNFGSTDVINLSEMPSSMSIRNGNLILESDVGTMSIEGSAGFDSSTNIKYEANGSTGIARVADEDLIVEYDRNVTYYDGVNNGTMNISTSNNAVVNLSSNTKHIARVDASSASGRVDISGDSLSNTLQGGTNNSTLWGGGGDDLLIGGDGKDVFRYTSADGNVTIQGGNSNDVIDLEMSFNNVSNYEFNANGVILNLGDSSLNVVGTSTTEFNFTDKTYTANYSEQNFS